MKNQQKTEDRRSTRVYVVMPHAASGLGGAAPAQQLAGPDCGIIEPKTRVPELLMAIDDLSCESERLSVSVAGLEQKIQPVLRGAPPSDTKANAAEAATEAGKRLFEIGARLRLIREAVDSMYERAEV